MTHSSHIYPRLRKRRGAQWRQHKHRQKQLQSQRDANNTRAIQQQAQSEYQWDEEYYEDHDRNGGSLDSLSTAPLNEHHPDFWRWPIHESQAGPGLEGDLNALRRLLFAPPSQESWLQLCHFLELLPADPDGDALLAYARRHLGHWPLHLRKQMGLLWGRFGWWEQGVLHIGYNGDGALWEQLEHLPRQLYGVQLVNAVNGALLRGLHQHTPQLKHLSLVIDIPENLGFIHLFEHLESLHIQSRMWQTIDWMPFLEKLPQLQRFSLNMAYHPSPFVLQQGLCLPGLKELSLERAALANQDALAGCFPHLESLRLHGIDFTALAPLQGLARLHSLDLHTLEQQPNVEIFPSLSGLRSLRLTGDELVDALDRSQGEPLRPLEGLGSLSIHASRARDLSWLANLSQVRDLKLKFCPELESLEFLSSMSGLHRLSLDDVLPWHKRSSAHFSLGKLQQLEVLKLRCCGELNPLESLKDGPTLPSLRELRMSLYGGSQLDFLEHTPALEKLQLSHSDTLTDPSGLRFATRLTELRLEAVENYDALPPLAGHAHLHTLVVGKLSQVRHLQAPHLQHLELQHWVGQTDLQALSSWTELSTLIVGYASSLRSLKGIEELEALRVLRIQHASALRSLEGIEDLEHLHLLELHKVDAPKELSRLAALPRLTYLSLPGCTLDGLDFAKHLPHLRCVHLQHCEGLGSGDAALESHEHLHTLLLPVDARAAQLARTSQMLSPLQVQVFQRAMREAQRGFNPIRGLELLSLGPGSF